MNEEFIRPPVNNQSTLSLVFGILTILSFCAALVPFPFTGFICFPVSLFFGILAMVFGTISLRRISRLNEAGSSRAWIGIMLGGFVFLCVVCMFAALASLYFFSPHTVPLPPFLQFFSI